MGLPGIVPAANLLLHTKGATKTKRALKFLDDLEQEHTTLAPITPAYWRHVHNRLEIGSDPHPFSRSQANAFIGENHVQKDNH